MKAVQEYAAVNPAYISFTQAEIRHKELKALNLFWFGFLVYTAAYVLFTAMPYNLMLNKIQLVGLVFITIGSISLVRFKIENTYLRTLYVLYCIWLLITVARGIKFDRESLWEAFFNAWYGVLPYFVPVVLLFPKNVFYLKKLFTVIVIAGALFLVYSAVYRGELLYPSEDEGSQAIIEIFAKTLSVPCGFLVLTYIYHSRRRNAFAFFVVIVGLLLAVVRGRRAITFMNVSYLVGFYIIYLYRNKIRFTTVVMSLFFLGVVGFAGFKFYTANKKGTFSLMTSRFNEDTRSAVEVCFYDDMKLKDWVIGKGMLGEYYCPGVDELTTETNYTDYRSMIETDYLNIILKSGLLGLGLLLLIVIPAIVKGFFHSNNILCKAAATWMLLWIFDLYPATVHTFTLNYILVWISVGICYSNLIRNMTDGDITEIFASRV